MLFLPKPAVCICAWDVSPVPQLTILNEKEDITAPEDMEKQPTVLIFPDLSSPTYVKDVREFEHGQRFAKKNVEHKMWKAHRKHDFWSEGFHPACALCRSTPPPRERAWLHGRPNTMRHVKGAYVRVDDDDDVLDVPEVDWVADVGDKPASIEVSLAELMKPAKKRRSRQKGMSRLPLGRRKTGAHTSDPKADDFELVPSVRSVIALEDSSASEPEVDDPWECVDWEKDDLDGGRAHAPAPTFAEILTKST